MIELYQFPLSHYCEKVRWALDYKKLHYTPRNLLPGLHIKKAKKLSKSSSLPILLHNGFAVSGSTDIITYLEQQFPDYTLTPLDAQLRHETLRWESYADNEIGGYVRQVCYHTLLDHPDLVIPFFTNNGPWYGRFLLKRIFPQLQSRMRRYMDVNDQSVEFALQKLDQAIDKIAAHLQAREFFVGQQFTRADIGVASLLAPFCRPQKYGLDWPERYPDKLEEVVERYAQKLNWVNDLYKLYR